MICNNYRMICTKKEIQSPQQNKYSKNSPNSFTERAFFIQKRNKQNQKINQQKNFRIDAWHIKSNSKFQNFNHKRNLIINNNQRYDQKPKSQEKQRLIQLKRLIENSEKPFENDSKVLNQQFTDLNQIKSPTKTDMLECSFRFEQYERQKAEQIRNNFIGQVQMERNKSKTSIGTKNKNFIQKNKNYVFELQNGIFLQQQRSPRLQQTKQQLKMNQQRLKQQSKQLHKFLSMKQQTYQQKDRSRQNRKSPIMKPITSFWSMLYLEKNSTKNLKKNNKLYLKSSRNTIFQNERLIQSSRENKVNTTYEKDQRQYRKKHHSLKKNNFTIKSNDLPFKNQFSKNLSNKFNRMLKLRNKPRKQNSQIKLSADQNIKLDSQILSQRSIQKRIHSKVFKKSIQKDKRNTIQSLQKDINQLFLNTELNLSGFKWNQRKISQQRRSISACAFRNQEKNIHNHSMLNKRIISRQKLNSQGMAIKGNTFELIKDKFLK